MTKLIDPKYFRNVAPGERPDLRGGSCMTDEGRYLMDDAGQPQIKDYAKLVRKARRMCTACPVLSACGRWATREDPPGDWGGFLAGRTALERALNVNVS